MENTKDNALMGSGEGYTLDADEAKKRIVERRNKLIAIDEVENPANNSRKNATDSGAKNQTIMTMNIQ